MIALAIDLNLIPMGVMPRLNVSQYDHGQEVTFVLWNGNVAYNLPAGTSVYIEGTKPDGTGFTYECTFENNQPVATITEQMTAVAGCVNCELVMLKDSARQGTINFILDVEPAALRADVPISETDIPIIERIPEMVAEATAQAQSAEAWATGGEGGEASETNNAKYWAEQSQSYAVGALHWKGNTTFANIPTTNLTTGDVYNVTDAFTTDSRFNEGAGIECEAGTNIIYGSNGKWDVQAPPSVHSFNGRKGAVVPASGDYTDAQVSSSAITGKATVKAALQGLDADVTQAKADIVQINTYLSVKSNSQELNTGLNGTCSIYKSGAMKQLSIYFNCTAGQLSTLSGYIVTLTTNNRPRTSMVGVAGDQSGNLRYVSINSANGTVRVFGANLENVTTLSLSCLYM